MYENQNLIPRILRQESSVIPVFKSRSCPVVFEYLEDLEFDERFDLSLFKNKSKSLVSSTVFNLEFVKDLETERENRSIDSYILNLQTSILASNIPKFLESTSATLGSSTITSSSRIPIKPPFIPTIAMQPTKSYQRPPISSLPPSTPSTPQTSRISSPPSTPHTPITSSTAIIIPTPPTSPRPVVNPPRAMAARYAPLVFPQNLDAMLTDNQRKIPLFDGTPQSITTQQHVDRITDFFDLHEINAENVTMRLFVQTFGGEVRKWFRALPATSITTLTNLQR